MMLKFFRRFTNEQEIDEISKILKSNDISHSIITPTSSLGSSFGSTFQDYFELHAQEEQFEFINHLIMERAVDAVDNIPTDHYLHSFSDSELQNIISNPSEWNEIDVVISSKIL